MGQALVLPFEVWEVKITGTASHLNRRFHLPGQIKGLAAGVRRPPNLQTQPHAHLSSPLVLTCSFGGPFGAVKKENTADK